MSVASSEVLRPVTSNKPRLWFLDNLKVALTVLVIVHHVGQAYGPTGGFWAFMSPDRWAPLGPFFWVNASFFMGLFFFISAYFLPSALERKGAGAFLKDRALRLGLPLLIFVLLVNPVLMYVSYINFRNGDLPFLQYMADIYFGLGAKPSGFTGPSWPDVNFGHLWFVEHLLIYGLCYGLWRLLWRRPAPSEAQTPARPPGDLAILGVTLALTAVTAVVRLWYPIDRWIGLLGFIQVEIAHLPQYLSFFVLGTVAYRRNWLTIIPTARGLRWLLVGCLGVVLGLVTRRSGLSPDFAGLIMITAESFIAVGLSLGLTILFRDHANTTGSVWRWLSANAYAAYLVHVPVVVALQYASVALPPSGMVRFLTVGLVGVPASFALGQLLRKLPGAGRIL